jgi:hypothetical protein
MAEHCQNVRRIKKAVAKMQRTATELKSAIADSCQLIAQSLEAMS